LSSVNYESLKSKTSQTQVSTLKHYNLLVTISLVLLDEGITSTYKYMLFQYMTKMSVSTNM